MDFGLLAFNGMTEMGWIIQQYGPLIAVITFFIWRDYCREDRLSTRVKELEDEQRQVEQRQVILPLVTHCTEVITRSTQVMDQNTKVMARLEKVIDKTLT